MTPPADPLTLAREGMPSHEDRAFLIASGAMFDPDEDGVPFAINLNDTFGWACADGESVPDDKIKEVATLFKRWGYPGLYYWAAKRRGTLDGPPSEFKDINRAIEFVRREEDLREREPSSSKRAYMDLPESPALIAAHEREAQLERDLAQSRDFYMQEAEQSRLSRQAVGAHTSPYGCPESCNCLTRPVSEVVAAREAEARGLIEECVPMMDALRQLRSSRGLESPTVAKLMPRLRAFLSREDAP